MGLVSGTQLTYDINGEREDLIDSIYNIDPTETPLLSLAGRTKATAITHEWQTDSLEAVDKNNVHLEGDEAAFDTPTPTVRVGNICQISRKTVLTSDTLEAISKAGRKSEEAIQWAKRMAEIKMDIDGMMSLNQGAVTGGAGTARRMAGLGAWVKTNVDYNTVDGGNPAYTSGVPGAARTDSATPRAFTETIAKSIMQEQYSVGGKARILMVGPVNRVKFSGFSGLATPYIDATRATPTAINASADVMVTDFGNIRVVPSRLQREQDAWFIDPSLVSVAYLRAFTTKRLAETGDSRKKLVTAEYTLKVSNEAGLALAADLTTT